jgi:hypothetical protein
MDKATTIEQGDECDEEMARIEDWLRELQMASAEDKQEE